MANDDELLREYTRFGSEEAFRELVDRHIGMVYSSAFRETDGDTAWAEELTQFVFVELARKAVGLVGHPALAGWLYTCVRWMAANARRAEDRRQRRQVEYQAMSEMQSSDSPESTWQQVRPVLDDALHELSETDRAAIVLRYFEGLSLKQVGTQLGLNENAARMRVDRAREKLHHLLSRRGIKSASAALAAALIAGAVMAAPAGLAASVARCAVASQASVPTTLAKLLKPTMTARKLVLLTALGVVLIGTIASIHLFHTHPELVHQFHQWLRHP